MRYKILKLNCLKKNIELTFAPVLLSRHRSNISFFYKKTQELYWMLEVVYMASSNTPSTTGVEGGAFREVK